MKEITTTLEDYIESILIVSNEEGAKINDIAKILNIKKSTVVSSIKKLKSMGLVEQKFYGRVKLTEYGRKKADLIYKRHRIIKEILINIGVNQEIADKEACLIEHFLSDDTIDKIFKKLGGK